MVQIDNPFAWLFIHMLAYFEYVMMGGFLVFMMYLYVAMTRDQRRYEEREKWLARQVSKSWRLYQETKDEQHLIEMLELAELARCQVCQQHLK